MYLSIITLPLVGALTAGLLGRKVGITGAQLITSTTTISCAVLALVSFYEVALTNSPVTIKLFSWIDSESLTIDWGFHFDALTVSMLIPVLIVSALVHVYSIGYMSHDPHCQRFFSYLSMFTFFMLILVTGDNYLVMFIGWEGVGISSYLLVSFWFTRIQANKSAISALLFNRVGDMFLTIGLFAIIFAVGNIDYAVVFSVAPLLNSSLVFIIGVCFLIGAMAKSAQIGLHVWLPQAMEGFLIIAVIYSFLFIIAAQPNNFNPSANILTASPLFLLNDKKWIGKITGCMLGDGSIGFSNGNNMGKPIGNARYSMTMKASSYSYLQQLKNDIFDNLTTLHDLIPYPNTNLPKHKDKIILQYYFNSINSELFTNLHLKWYKWNSVKNQFIKIVPKEIEKDFTIDSLCHWIIQDGYFDNYARTNTILLSTDNFSKKDCLKLLNVLQNLNIRASLKIRDRNKEQYRIRISKNSVNDIRRLISSKIPSEFQYKLGL